MSRRSRTAPLLFIALLASLAPLASLGAWAASTPPGMDEAAQDARLRARLERIFYEQEFMIRNERIDRSDLKHQEKQFEVLKVFERIPFRDDLPGLRSSLNESAREKSLNLISFRALHKPRARVAPVPSQVYSDVSPPFKLSEEQLVEKVPFATVIEGERSTVLAWIGSWREDQMRLTEPSAPLAEQAIKPAGPRRWEVRAHAFRFREVKFPTIQPRDPMSILPDWAQGDSERFAKTKPRLWELVTKTQAISPQARSLFRNREQMQLNAARMSVFLSKAGPPPRHSRN